MAEIYVTSTADSGAGSLRQAIADAADGDVILFDPVVFPQGQTTVIYLSSNLTVSKSISIYGGESDGEGGYTSGATITRYVKREIEGVETEVVVDDEHPALDGEHVLFHVVNRVALDGQGDIHCCHISAPEGGVAIKGLTFQHGGGGTNGGAGVRVEWATSATNVAFEDCAILECVRNNGEGSGVLITTTRAESVATFTRCEFRDCGTTAANTDGGGYYSQNVAVGVFENCCFVGCYAARYGGAICSNSNSQNTLTECSFESCTASTSGGAICSYSNSQNTLTECSFESCTASTYGGAIYSYSNSQNTLTECSFESCTSTSGGAIMTNSAGRVVFVGTGCRIKDCEATDNGSGVYDQSLIWTDVSAVAFVNCEYVAARTPEQQTVRYFTTTADSGEGSLRATVADARQNDIIRPDSTVFDKGATVEIKLSSALAINKRLRLEGHGRRIVLDGQGTTRLLTITDGASALVAEDVDFINGYDVTATNGAAIYSNGAQGITFVRCILAGNYGARTFNAGGAAGWRLVSCAAQGNVATNVISYSLFVVAYNSTFAGNYKDGAPLSFANVRGVNAINCNASTLPSTVGFVNAPPDALPLADWNKDLWREWDLSLTPESSYNHGAVPLSEVDATIVGSDAGYDILGLPFVAGGALGAYEFTGATIYWTGFDSTGAAVQSPSFSSADGWTTNPTIRAASDRIPSAADVALIPRGDAFAGVFEGPTIILSGSDDFSGTLTDGHVDVGTFDFTGALNLAGSVYIDGDVAEIEVSIDGTLHVSQDTTVKELTLASGSSVVFDVDGVFLSATDAATVGTTTFSATTRAYFAAPVATNVTAATFNNVVACDYGADVTAFSASGGVLSWIATDPTIGVLLEQQDGEDWTTLAERATSYTTRFPMKSAPVRLFDGEKFLTVDVGEYSCFWRITDWATFAGGDSDAYFSVKSWAIDPETSED